MSRSTCSNSKSRVSTAPAASAQNMNASSGSGLWPRRISICSPRLQARSRRSGSRSSDGPPAVSGRRSVLRGAAEEPALERTEQLGAYEGARGDRGAVLLQHADVVLEHL